MKTTIALRSQTLEECKCHSSDTVLKSPNYSIWSSKELVLFFHETVINLSFHVQCTKAKRIDMVFISTENP